MTDSPSTFYRPHIDGLRGIAVLAVVLYHAKLLSVTGGFVGVDVFFVISGYLITGVVVRELESGSFSLLGFWERRLRRILPALFVVMIATIIGAYFLILYPEDYRYFGSTVIAQSVFFSNVLFMFSDNYFNEHSTYVPLLHTWSLSVEEQFYIFFPFLALLATWIARQTALSHISQSFLKMRALSHNHTLVVIVGFLGGASLLLNIWFVDASHRYALELPFIPDELFWGITYATAGFYLLLTRLWELALGVLVALVVVQIRSVALAELLTVLGISAIGLSAYFFTDGTLFPGTHALVPTIGAAAILLANKEKVTRMGALLSWRPLVAIGVISYGLYLWHWPLLVFARIAQPTPLSSLATTLLIVVALLLSALSYRYIESPIRKKNIIPERNRIFLISVVALFVLTLSGFMISRSSVEYSNRVSTYARDVLTATDESMPWGGACDRTQNDQSGEDVCRIGATTSTDSLSREKFVVWGDSHADMLAPLLSAMGQAHAKEGIVFAGGNCIPVIGVHQVPPAEGCEAENEFALRYIRKNDIRHIILIARWNNYIVGRVGGVHTALLSDVHGVSMTPDDAGRVFERNFIPMVHQLLNEGREIYIVMQVPEQPHFNARNLFYDTVRAGEKVQLHSTTRIEHYEHHARVTLVFSTLLANRGVHLIDPTTILCANDAACMLEHDGKFIYRDESHLSTAGAMSLWPIFTPIFEDMNRVN